MPKKPVLFRGVATAMVTPFTQDGGLNLKTFDHQIEFQIDQGTKALVVCGTTGEPSTMDISEEAVLIARAVDRVGGRVPVIAGAGSNDTAFAVRSAKQAKHLGADAILSVTPYYNKTTQRGLIRHFLTIADATDLPIIIYNVPSRTGLNILPQTLAEIAKHPNIVAIKEASENIKQLGEMVERCPDLTFYSGADELVVPILAYGGQGVISVVSNITPRLTSGMVEDWLAGDHEKALAAQLKLQRLIRALFCETNPIPIKTAMRDLGWDVGPLRLPLVDMDEANHAELRAAMEALGLFDTKA